MLYICVNEKPGGIVSNEWYLKCYGFYGTA
jgi:hypothetical protein